MKTVAVITRSGLLVAAAALILLSFLYPMWYMYLDSNNYPRGLGMAVYATHPGDTYDRDQLDGGLKEVNVLNHYIGMREISPKMWVFKVLPAILIALAVLCLIAAVIQRFRMTLIAFIAFAAVSAGGVVTLIYTLYDYGHNLDPQAAIEIEPFMPGLYGEHHLAQFTTYSDFYWGTYLLVIAFFLVVGALAVDFFARRRAVEPQPISGDRKE